MFINNKIINDNLVFFKFQFYLSTLNERTISKQFTTKITSNLNAINKIINICTLKYRTLLIIYLQIPLFGGRYVAVNLQNVNWRSVHNLDELWDKIKSRDLTKQTPIRVIVLIDKLKLARNLY